MDKFLAGMIAGLLIERYHLINASQEEFPDASIIPEMAILPIAVMAGFAVFLIWVYRSLSRTYE